MLSMSKFCSLYENLCFLTTTVTLFFLFGLAVISTFSSMQQDAYALNCKQVDDRSNGRCDVSRDISEKHYRDCIKDINCFATKTVNVQNTLSSSEQAKIDIDLQQLVNCGNEDCLNL